jgi:Protein of unknown function (DUF3991)/Toprim-like
MSASADAELQLFRATVNCAAVLERMTGGWKLDVRESTKRALKYRRGPGEIIIVNHEGQGWWDAIGSAKGDVFSLVQHLDPSLNFGQVRQVLRRFVDVTPNYPQAVRGGRSTDADRPVAERWARRPRLRRGSDAWTYLTGQRALTGQVLIAAAAQDIVREGPYGSAWFAHCLHEIVSHVEIRGPAYKGALTGGHKTLFRFGGVPTAMRRRLAIAEAPIDALSLAVLEDMRGDTLYAATGGGMGPGTIAAIEALLTSIATNPGALLVSATDANAAGERYAARHAELAAAAGVACVRLRPTIGADWNDVLKQGRGP